MIIRSCLLPGIPRELGKRQDLIPKAKDEERPRVPIGFCSWKETQC